MGKTNIGSMTTKPSEPLIICPLAGVGLQFFPLTITKPKAMMKIAGKKIIDYLMEKLMETFPKRTQICFIVGYKKKAITQYITDQYSGYFDIFFREQRPVGYKNEMPFFSGLGDAIGLAGKFGKGRDCLIVLSDRIPLENYKGMIDKIQLPNIDGIINVKEVPNPEYYGACMIDSSSSEEIITRVKEKPKNFPSKFAISGAYAFSHRITEALFTKLEKQMKATLNPDVGHQFTPIIQELIDEGKKIVPYHMEQAILDFGRVQTLLEGNQILTQLNQSSDEMIREKEEKLYIQHTKIIPPVYLGKNCQITESVIGPNVSIGDNVIITRSIINNAVIGDCTTLDQVISEDSIIGDFVTLEHLIKKNISIGDSSTIATTF